MDAITVSSGLFEPAPPAASPAAANPSKIHEAAQQFEALLLAEMLRSAHPSGGWLGGGEDGASDTAGGFAEEQLAVMMARQGGIGLARLVSDGLERAQSGSISTGGNG